MGPITGAEFLLGLVAAAGGAIGVYVGLRLAPIEKDIKAVKEQCERDNKALSDRINALHDDNKDAREKLEARLQAIEKTYIDRAELNRAIEAFGERSDRNTARIEQVVMALGVKVDHLAERVAKAEAS